MAHDNREIDTNLDVMDIPIEYLQCRFKMVDVAIPKTEKIWNGYGRFHWTGIVRLEIETLSFWESLWE